MAIVNVSLDTANRNAVLTIDGVLIPSNDFSISQFIDIDKEKRLHFEYTVEGADHSGMKEIRRFFLPSPEDLATEAHSGLGEDGLASQVVHNDDKAKADVIDFLKVHRNPE